MPQNLNRHQHKAAAAEARQFPANEEQLAEYLRTVHELRQTQIAPPSGVPRGSMSRDCGS